MVSIEALPALYQNMPDVVRTLAMFIPFFLLTKHKSPKLPRRDRSLGPYSTEPAGNVPSHGFLVDTAFNVIITPDKKRVEINSHEGESLLRKVRNLIKKPKLPI